MMKAAPGRSKLANAIVVKVGGDFGCGESTLTTAPDTSLTIPSYVAVGSQAELRRVRGGSHSSSVVADDEYILDHLGRTYFVGRLAYEQGTNATNARDDISRYWSGHTLRLLLTLVGAAYSADSVTVRLVTGLPVIVWTPENVARVQQSLCGVHTFKLNGRERQVIVPEVLVMMEGAGAMAKYGSQENAPQGVLDCGTRTLDLFQAQGMDPILDRCAGRPIGVDRIADEIQRWFEDEHKRPLTVRELRDVLHSYVAGQPHAPIYTDSGQVVINGEVGRIVDGIAEEIVSFVSACWSVGQRGQVASNLSQIIFVGGGAHYFRKHIERLLPRVVVPKKPELANAEGYHEVAQVLDERDWAAVRREL
jgi:hypothetical protein